MASVSGSWFIEVDRGGQNLIAQRQNGDACFQAAGAAQQMSGHRLGRTYGNLALAKKIADGVSLQRVADRAWKYRGH